MTIGYGSGLPHDGTGFFRLPVTGGDRRQRHTARHRAGAHHLGVTVTGVPAGFFFETSAAHADGGVTPNSVTMTAVAMPIRPRTTTRRTAAFFPQAIAAHAFPLRR